LQKLSGLKTLIYAFKTKKTFAFMKAEKSRRRPGVAFRAEAMANQAAKKADARAKDFKWVANMLFLLLL
jgi:hypothetical protein